MRFRQIRTPGIVLPAATGLPAEDSLRPFCPLFADLYFLYLHKDLWTIPESVIITHTKTGPAQRLIKRFFQRFFQFRLPVDLPQRHSRQFVSPAAHQLLYSRRQQSFRSVVFQTVFYIPCLIVHNAVDQSCIFVHTPSGKMPQNSMQIQVHQFFLHLQKLSFFIKSQQKFRLFCSRTTAVISSAL